MFLGSFPIIYLEFTGKLSKLWAKIIIELKKFIIWAVVEEIYQVARKGEMNKIMNFFLEII